MLQDKGIPMPVERTMICPPRCRMGAITPAERSAVRATSPLGSKYDTRVNRESAYEILAKRSAAKGPADRVSGSKPRQPAPEKSQPGGKVDEILWGTKRRQGVFETLAKQAARTVGGQLGRQILRGVLGGIFGGSRRG
jgi:hypothetical protein